MSNNSEVLFEPNRFVVNNGQALAARAFLDQLLLTITFLYTKSGRKRSTPKLRPSYDYIVVGGGTAGTIVAARLSEDPSVSVLVLESGGSTSEYSHIPRLAIRMLNSTLNRVIPSVPQRGTCGRDKESRCQLRVGNVLGGSSSTNVMYWVRGNRLDFDEWSLNYGLRNWSYSDLLPYFNKIEDNQDEFDRNPQNRGPVGITTRGWSGLDELTRKFLAAGNEVGYPIRDYNGDQQASFYPTWSNTRNGVRQSTDLVYLTPAEGRPNLDIVTFAKVTRVLFNDQRRAVGVEYDRDGSRHQVFVNREVILSAGALITPQLLMLSGIGPGDHLRQHRIPVVLDLPGVGQNFHDHLRCQTDFTTSLNFPDDGFITKKSLDEWQKLGTGVLSSNFIGVANIRLRTSMSPDDTQGELSPNYEMTKDPITSLPKFLLQIYSWPLKPTSRGSIQLRSSNPNDDPLVDPAYVTTKYDLENNIELLSGVLKLMQTRPFQEINAQPVAPHMSRCDHLQLWSQEYLACFTRYACQNDHHYVGSARMGADNDPMAVVDDRLRVRGIVGLRVVDASVMPSITRGNTMATTMVIGEKAADMIKDDWRGII